MGAYTDPFQFYLIDDNELVNVENDIHYNLDRVDTWVRPLVEYQLTDVFSITDSDMTKSTGFKFYKTRSDSIWTWINGAAYQDPNCFASAWSTSGITYEAGYQDFDDSINRVGYQIEDGIVRLRGRVIAVGSAELPLQSTVNVLTLPVACRPNVSKYFWVHGGEATGNFQAFRIFIPSASDPDPRMEFFKYGANASSAAERYLSLNDIEYPLVV